MKASDLACAIQSDSILKYHVLGVFAKDTLPVLTRDMLARGVGLIVNTEPSGRLGRHWVAMYFKGNTGELFDSLGEPVNSVFDLYLKTYVNQYQHNRRQLQSSSSSLCGHYCLYYLLYKCKTELTLQTLVQIFDGQVRFNNDEHVSKFICNYFRYCLLSCHTCVM